MAITVSTKFGGFISQESYINETVRRDFPKLKGEKTVSVNTDHHQHWSKVSVLQRIKKWY